MTQVEENAKRTINEIYAQIEDNNERMARLKEWGNDTDDAERRQEYYTEIKRLEDLNRQLEQDKEVYLRFLKYDREGER